MTPFDIASNINEKKPLLEDFKEYSAFMINRIFSNTSDTVFFANEMNKHASLDKLIQYHFYYFGLNKKKRYGKWHKNEVDFKEIDIQDVMLYYNYSRIRAVEALGILTVDDVKKIKKLMDRGGKRDRD